MRECVLMKLSVRSGRVRESFTHCPGLGSGTFELATGSQLEVGCSCSLKAPSKDSVISRREKAQTADPLMLFGGVVNTPYTS